jgi:UDP-glucose:O-linked fucose beta-1,3-glucosyltransferase
VKQLAIGERYGYEVSSPNARGYNFMSGGGGMILNRRTALRLNKECNCPSADPTDRMDDVYLGSCLNQMRIPIVHSERLHQVPRIEKHNKVTNV